MNSADTCDKCGKIEAGIDDFAKAYRKMTLRRNLPDPGNLCGACAGSAAGKRIAEQIIEKDTP